MKRKTQKSQSPFYNDLYKAYQKSKRVAVILKSGQSYGADGGYYITSINKSTIGLDTEKDVLGSGEMNVAKIKISEISAIEVTTPKPAKFADERM